MFHSCYCSCIHHGSRASCSFHLTVNMGYFQFTGNCSIFISRHCDLWVMLHFFLRFIKWMCFLLQKMVVLTLFSNILSIQTCIIDCSEEHYSDFCSADRFTNMRCIRLGHMIWWTDVWCDLCSRCWQMFLFFSWWKLTLWLDYGDLGPDDSFSPSPNNVSCPQWV